MKLTSRHYKILGKAFTNEYQCSPYPMQTRSKLVEQLAEAGLLRHVIVPHQKFSNTTIPGWRLTPAGQVEYFQWASRQRRKGAKQ